VQGHEIFKIERKFEATIKIEKASQRN